LNEHITEAGSDSLTTFSQGRVWTSWSVRSSRMASTWPRRVSWL